MQNKLSFMFGKTYTGAYLLLLFFSSVTLTACSSGGRHHTLYEDKGLATNALKLQVPALSREAFEQKIIPDTDIFKLSKEHRDAFLVYFYDKDKEHIKPYKRLGKFIETKLSDFTFRGETYTAEQAINNQSGNCLSLAILSTAYTELVGLDYRYNKVHVTPVYSEQAGVLFVSGHVNFTIFGKRAHSNGYFTFQPRMTIDYFRPREGINSSEITKNDIKILYWHNKIGDALVRNEIDIAFAYLEKAYQLNPLDLNTLNLLAILYKRKGLEELAYSVYEFMITNKLYSFNAIDNFVSILRSKGEYKRAIELEKLVSNVNDDNPYIWFYKGVNSLQQQNTFLAKKYFARAIELAPYLHEPHFELAKLYGLQGKKGQAKSAMKQALSLAYLPEDKKLYQAKLYQLKSIEQY